jgi:hypothetical protein
MSQPSNHLGPLSVYWAFVVQFDTRTDVARGQPELMPHRARYVRTLADPDFAFGDQAQTLLSRLSALRRLRARRAADHRSITVIPPKEVMS